MHNSKTPIAITVDVKAAKAHLFNVTIFVDGARALQRVALPAWTPGSYMIREFAQHIVSFKAFDGDAPCTVKKIDKNTFEINNHSKTIMLAYEVYGFDSSIRAAFIDDQQAFFNGCALFVRIEGHESSPCTLKVCRPEHREFQTWQVATGMPRVDVDERGFGTYKAKNYDELVDYPFQISEMKRVAFFAKDVPHEIVLVGDVRPFDDERLARDLSSLCTYHIDLFGGIAPFSSYTFLSRFEEGGYGGLEHRNSSMLLSSPHGLPKSHREADAHYRNFLGLCSHEYFHAWNIKRLKPRNFIPFDYDRECYTPLLWIFEGITSYYDDLALRRAQLISDEGYLEMMSKNYGRLLRNSGRRRQSVADASFDAWIKFYRPNENSNNVTTSYYLNGSFVALYLDLLIRNNSKNIISLDTVMNEAYKKYHDEGILEADFFSLMETVGGIDAINFKNRFIYGTEELPLEPLLAQFGVHMLLHDDETILDDKIKMQAYLGFKYRFDDHGRAMIFQVDYDSPAMQAGLSPLDEIIALNNIRFEPHNAADFLSNVCPSDMLNVVYSRKKMLKSSWLHAASLPKSRCIMAVMRDRTPQQKLWLEQWLHA